MKETIFKRTIQIFHLTFVTMLAGYLGKLYLVTDQFFISRISGDHLHAHALLTYPFHFLNYAAIVTGFSLLVILGGKSSEKQRLAFAGAVSFLFLAGLTIGVAITLSASWLY